ncbi:MAG: hypothetical protein AAGG68_30435 [Bacteroidota bacterium]
MGEQKKKKHRGRWQAQGGGLEKSEAWSQDEPLSKEDGLDLLHKLKEQLSERELKEREQLFEQAERFVNNAQGVDAHFSRSFRSRKKRGIRVDLEIKAGSAFVVFIGLILLFIWLMK